MGGCCPIWGRRVRELGYRKPGKRWTSPSGTQEFSQHWASEHCECFLPSFETLTSRPDSSLDIGTPEGHCVILQECIASL